MAVPAARGPEPAAVGSRLIRNAAGALRDAVLWPLEARVPREWIALRLDRGLAEASAQPAWLEERLGLPRALPAALAALERAARDPAVFGVAVRLGRGALGWAKVAALARAFAALRAAGKRLVAYADVTGNGGAWLGGLADHFWLAPAGRVDLLGIRVETPFVRGLLDRLGVRPEVLAAGRYKSIGELLVRDSMSPPAREALESVVDSLYAALVGGLAAGRARDADEARGWIDGGPYLAAQAREIGLVDELVYPDEIPARLAALADAGEQAAGGEPREAQLVSDATYLRIARDRFAWRPLVAGRPAIAVVTLVGMLRHGAGAAREATAALGRLRESRQVRAAVLRIESPGGDPLAADLLWRAARRLAETRPVVASLGDAAASGGYYAAAGANAIVAEATTLTGSIGVVLASLAFEGLLDSLGVRVESVERGRHAGIYDPLRPRSPEERSLLRRQVDALYRDFVGRVATGRGVAESAVEPSAQGRVWTGEQALERGLVDEIGGLDAAVARARRLAGLAEDEGEVVHVARPVARFRLLRAAPAADALSLGEAQLVCPLEVPLS
jgi:protease-4